MPFGNVSYEPSLRSLNHSRKNTVEIFLDPDHELHQQQNRMVFLLMRHPIPQKFHKNLSTTS